MKFVNVIVDISHEKLDKIFQYKIPENLQGMLALGMQVDIPFGRGNRPIKGYIVGFSNEADYPEEKIKSLLGIAKGSIQVEQQLIAMAAWMKERYSSTMNQALKTVLPVKQEVMQKQKRTLFLLLSEEEGKALLEQFLQKHYVAKARLLATLLDHREQGFDYDRLIKEQKITAAMIQKFSEEGILRIESKTAYRNPFAGHFVKKISTISLSEQQSKAVEGIWADYLAGERKTYLLHGVTGSGKTEVYMEVIQRVIADGKQAILLIPEIALTVQTVRRFYERFGERVSVMHSRLSEGEKYDQFMRAKEGKIDVMIGPRSALFTPFAHLGVIIIDEEHEASYKSENVPRYHARDAAIFRAKLCNAFVILGSATPSLESYYRAEQKEYEYYALTQRIGEAKLPSVSIVDLRKELKEGNRSIFSRKLYAAMKERLEKQEQIMLFLNRRGFSGFVSCRSCGKAIRCPHCDVSLSLHQDGMLRCHYCGYEIPMPSLCPSCSSKYISAFRAGTQQIEQEVKKVFPNVKVLRMDYDTTRMKDSYEQILTAFAKGEAQILVGTQMIVKGHDFPNVTLIGILAADISLYATDYRASERTFQLLTQAAGRAGRGVLLGEAVIQTYMPEHYSIQTAAKQDYQAFYEQEILYRSLMAYPPVCSLLGIYLSCMDEGFLCQQAEVLGAYLLQNKKEGVSIIGPTEAVLSKKNDVYRRVMYLKHEKEQILLEMKKELEQKLESESVWEKISIQFDFQPLNAY